MKQKAESVTAETAELKQQLTERGLDPGILWELGADESEHPATILRDILRWTDAYSRWPSRAEMEKRGFLYPPVNPDFDPDADWLRFQRWMSLEPVTWNFCREFGPLGFPAKLTDRKIESELVRIQEQLTSRGVALDISANVPPRTLYTYLQTELTETDFEFLPPASRCHLTGCQGCCEECFQHQWCEISGELARKELPKQAEARRCAANRVGAKHRRLTLYASKELR